MPYGWTQSSKTWTIKENILGDTIIDYSFYKEDIKNLHLYVVDLEEMQELYYNLQEQMDKKNKEILGLKNQVSLKDSALVLSNQVFNYQKNELKDMDKKYTDSEKQKIKYKKQASLWPAWLGTGGALGILVCLLLNK